MGLLPDGYFSCPKAAFVLLGLTFLESLAYAAFITINVSFWMESVGVEQKIADDTVYIYGVLNHVFPLAAGFLADNYFGRYALTLTHIIVYVAGFTSLAASTFVPLPTSAVFGGLGVLLNAIAEGISRSVNSTFQADQFPKDGNDAARNRMFSWDYLMVNVGATVTMWTIASFKDWYSCFGHDKCYIFTYGSCLASMGLALLTFFIFRKSFVRPPRKNNVVIEAFKCVFCAIFNRGGASKSDEENSSGDRPRAGADASADSSSSTTTSGPFRFSPNTTSISSKDMPTGGCLDRAYPRFERKFISDVAQVLRMSRMFFVGIPFAFVYQSIYGFWIHQFEHVNGQVGEMTFTPLTYLTFNPIVVVVSIFLLNTFIYPLLSKCFKVTPLFKIGSGAILTVLALVCVVVVEYKVEANQLAPLVGGARVEFWRHPAVHKCNVTLRNKNTKIAHNLTLNCSFAHMDMTPGHYEISSPCTRFFEREQAPTKTVHVKDGINVFALYPSGPSTIRIVSRSSIENKRTKSGSAHYYVISCQEEKICEYKKNTEVQEKKIGEVVEIKFTLFDALDRELRDCNSSSSLSIPINLRGSMGSKTAVFDERSCDKDDTHRGFKKRILVAPNAISSLWMWPQNFVLAIAEAMLAVGALEFAYHQSAASMKSVCQALWSLTGALGCLLGLLINQFSMTNIFRDFVHIGIMTAGTVIFLISSKFYHHIPEEAFLEESDEKSAKEEN